MDFAYRKTSNCVTRAFGPAARKYTLKNINHSIPLTGLLLSVFLSAGLFFSQQASAGSEHNVGGFAWSGMNAQEAIGWVGFNNVAVGGVAGSGGGISYGVNIDEATGAMSGNAWAAVDKDASNNPQGLGWVTFDQGQLGGCPDSAANCRAWVTTTPDGSGRYWVNGWARVLFKDGTANSGGWDGWIHLNTTACDTNNDGKSNVNSAICPHAGDPVYGVYIDGSGDFHGFGWSDMVLGWMNFNSANCDGTNCTANAAYKVHTTASFLPVAVMECGGSACAGGTCDNSVGATWVMYPPTGCPGCVFQVLNKSTGNIQCTRWELVGTPYAVVDHSNSKPNHTFQPNVPTGTYTLKLTVSDVVGDNNFCNSNLAHTSTATRLIQIKNETNADFVCSLNNPEEVAVADQVWANCNDANFKKKLVKGEMVFLKDASMPSEGATQINSYTWTINGVTSTGSSASFSAAKSNSIRIDVVDNYGGIGGPRNDCKTVTAGAKSLPDWIEISPVGFIWQYLVANISKIFATL